MYDLHRTHTLNDKEIYIVENHHEVLCKWYDYDKINMITFDCHTDTQPAFQNYTYHNSATKDDLICKFNNSELSLENVISYLKNDEHIDFAL